MDGQCEYTFAREKKRGNQERKNILIDMQQNANRVYRY